MITEVEDYFELGCGRCERFATPECSTRRWIDGLNSLRAMCLDKGLLETAKWGHPVYMSGGRNVAMLGAFLGDFRLSFFNASLMNDPEGILELNGPNAAHPSVIRFTNVAQVAASEAVIRSYLKEAMGYAQAGLVPARQEADLELPDELIEALDGDPEMAEAFHALTPGRRKSYVINLRSARTAATREARLAKFRPGILAGKGPFDR